MVVMNIKGAKRLGTLVVTPEEYFELTGNSDFMTGTPTDSKIPDGYVGVMPLFGGKLYAWVIVEEPAKQ